MRCRVSQPAASSRPRHAGAWLFLLLVGSNGLLAHGGGVAADEVRAGVAGNLCRCTGYMSIVESILAAADALAGAGSSRRAP